MSTVAHTILEFGPDQEVKLPNQRARRFVVKVSATYVVSSPEGKKCIEDLIIDAIDALNGVPMKLIDAGEIDMEKEEPTARIEIHNIPEEPGT